ncbi:MAG: dihydroxy-acid dehydratase, partial [Rhodobacterales bacterium]|nr:dihydroxy-acid dehydratase [Rhodobacterales bacterium]MDX5499712.1 dihydroxy-acid dehydratase [Rhodobacterales bacterium]
VPAAIHVCPEAADGGALAKLRDGDVIRLDAGAGLLEVLTPGVLDRAPVVADLSGNAHGTGRELFARLRAGAGAATEGASIIF